MSRSIDFSIPWSYSESKIKKILSIVIIILILIALGAGAYMKLSSKKSSLQPTMMKSNTPTETSMMGSIQDALTNKALSLQCNFTDDTGNQTTAYIKAGAIRTNVIAKTQDQSGNMIFKDSKMYFWNDATKQGFMMTLTPDQVKTMQDQVQSGVAPTGQATQGQNALSMVQKFKDSCKPAVVADSLFVAPTDVKFTDYSALMNQVKTIPSGGQMSQEQIQQMMQQYQGQK